MKLYYSAGGCSLSPHIVMREAGIPVQLVKVDLQSKKTEDGTDFKTINSKGYVPTLELPDGQRLTEGPAIVQYLADQVPARGLAPACGTIERYRLQEWLNFLATEIHKIYWPIFHEGAENEMTHAREKLAKSFDWVEKKLGAGPWLMGEQFTVADAYLVTVLNWTKPGGIDLSRWPGLAAYRLRVRERPAVLAALDAEGLLKKR